MKAKMPFVYVKKRPDKGYLNVSQLQLNSQFVQVADVCFFIKNIYIKFFQSLQMQVVMLDVFFNNLISISLHFSMVHPITSSLYRRGPYQHQNTL